MAPVTVKQSLVGCCCSLAANSWLLLQLSGLQFSAAIVFGLYFVAATVWQSVVGCCSLVDLSWLLLQFDTLELAAATV